MLHKQQYQFDSLRRVQLFLDTPGDAVGPLKDTDARKQLDQAVEQGAAHIVAQGLAEREFGGFARTVKALVADLKGNHMTPLAKFARANLRGVPDYQRLADVPQNLSGGRLVSAAKAMAAAAQPYADQLAKAQFPTGSVQQLSAAADALDKALTDRATAQSERVGATAGVKQELALGREAVAKLDPIVLKKLAGQKDLLARWRQAKRVTLTPQLPAIPVVAPATVVPPVPASVVRAPTAAAAKEVRAA